MRIISLTYVSIFLIQFTEFRVARGFDIHEFDQRCTALYKVMNYLVQRHRQINVDGLFGITLAEAHLLAALHHPNVKFLPPRYKQFITQILQFFERTRLIVKNEVLPESQDVALINAVLNEPILWDQSIIWKRGSLGKRPQPTPGMNRNLAEKLIYYGTPQENESDRCIGELIMESLEGQCKVSDNCAEMLVRRDESAGYPLTHRLLYVQISRILKCQEKGYFPFEQLVNTYCKNIFQNLVDIEANAFPGISSDLAIEQVLLCGMEGYEDFVNDYYATMIRDWMHPAGCYNAKGFINPHNNPFNASLRKSSITRRSAGPMDFGCDNHATGLAAGVLAMFVRESIENINFFY